MFQSTTADEQDGNIIEDCNDNDGSVNDNNSNPIDSHEDYPSLVGCPTQAAPEVSLSPPTVV